MKYLIVILISFFFTKSLFADMVIRDNFTYSKASSFMEYFSDTNNQFRIENIGTVEWKKMESTNLGGFNNYPTWTRFTITNSAQKTLNLMLKNPRATMDEIDVYVIKSNNTEEHHNLGDQRSIKNRVIAHRYSILPLSLEAGEEVLIVSRLINRISSTDGEWEVYLHSTFSEFSMLESMWWGLYSGFSLSLLCYLALVLVASKDKVFVLLFALYVLCTLGYQLSTNGILYSFGFSEHYINFVTVLFGSLFVLFTILVVLRFLKLSQNQGIVNRILRVFVIALIVQIIILCLSLSYDCLVQLAAYMSIYISLISYFGWLLLLKGFLTISQKDMFRYMFFGYTAIVIAHAYHALTIVGFIEVDFLTTYAVSIGIIIEMYFFAVAITLYIKQIHQEKENQSKLIDYQMRFISIGKVIGNIVHQWKIPLVRLGALITHIESVTHDKNGTFKEIEELIPQIRSNCYFMKSTIDEFFYLYSRNSSQTNYKLSKVIYDVWGMLSAKALSSHVQLDLRDDKEVTIESYEHTFAHVMIVLMDNVIDVAKKRAIDNPLILIEILPSSDYVTISVEDNCGGIEQTPVESIFDLNIIKNEDKLVQNGIGLSIVKTLVCEKLDGDISVMNKNNGASFKITIPISQRVRKSPNIR